MRWASPVTLRWLARRAHSLIHFKLSLSVYVKWWADNEISVRLAEISESGPLRSFLCDPFFCSNKCGFYVTKTLLLTKKQRPGKKKNSSAIVQFDATTQSNPIAQTGKYYIRPHYAKLPRIFFFFSLFREQLYGTVPSLTSLECSSSHDVYFCDSFAASLCVKNELELEYKDRATLLVTQTLLVVQGRTPNHLDLLNLK